MVIRVIYSERDWEQAVLLDGWINWNCIIEVASKITGPFQGVLKLYIYEHFEDQIWTRSNLTLG